MIFSIENFSDVDRIINQKLVMIIAKTHTCSSCKTIENILKVNLSNFEKIDKYTIFVDDLDRFRGDHLIFSVPTVMIFSEGKELLRESKYFNYEKIDRLIEMFLN